jgi:hypothetical protein
MRTTRAAQQRVAHNLPTQPALDTTQPSAHREGQGAGAAWCTYTYMYVRGQHRGEIETKLIRRLRSTTLQLSAVWGSGCANGRECNRVVTSSLISQQSLRIKVRYSGNTFIHAPTHEWVDVSSMCVVR